MTSTFDTALVDARTHRFAARLRRRSWPIGITILSVVTGMAYCMWSGPAIYGYHSDAWRIPGDIWGAFRSAQFIAWGDFGNVYGAGTGLVTFPGILLLFAPVALLAGAFNMTENFPFTLQHPTAWLILGPYEILLSCATLFAFDALAERLGVSRMRRRFLCVIEGVALWNISTIWGHPEDAVAVALSVYALVLALDGRWSGAGWLFGAALATQPLVVLMLPVVLALAGKQRAIPLLVRVSLPSVLLLAAPLAAEFHVTSHALLAQPNFPNIDHRTPWTAFAPRLGGHGQGLKVAAGPGRVVAILLAGAVGLWSRRWRAQPEKIVLAVALTFSLRCFTESVMVSFYVWPVLAVGLVVMMRRARWQWLIGAVTAVAVTVCSDAHLGEWAWWILVNGGIVVVLLCGIPSRLQCPVPITTNAADQSPVSHHLPVLVGARP
jgi:hypothetical protein